VRIRIALTTAVAVNAVVVFAVLTTLLQGDSARAQAATRQEAVSVHSSNTHHPVRINDQLMSYAQAQKVAQMVTYANAVESAQRATFYKDLIYLQDLRFFQAVAAQEQTIPAAWMPTAVCEEGGRNDPNAGYFGILEWHHFGGYPTAGSAPLSVQLAWEAAHGQGPPDGPGECHGY
jgi:hypothetical protein